jgi:hypothetical protein
MGFELEDSGAWPHNDRGGPGPAFERVLPHTLNHDVFDAATDRLYGCKHRGDASRETKDGALQRCCPKVRFSASYRRECHNLDATRHIGPQRIFASSARESIG